MGANSSHVLTGENTVAFGRAANDDLGGACAVLEMAEVCYGGPSVDDWRRAFTLIALQFLRRLSGFDDGGRGWDAFNERLLVAHAARLRS